MPQGIKPASNCFQRTMETTFAGLEEKMLPPFYDDVMIKSSNFTEHLENVDHILARTQESGFTLNVLKCLFFQIKVAYLGHIIENGKISLDPKRVEVIKNFPVPKNVKEIRRFIGMAQFCRRFVKNLNVILSPLYQLTKANTNFIWSTECQFAFDKIKDVLTEAPVLMSPTNESTFILETDACDSGIGSCLKIKNDVGEECKVNYDSAKFSDTEMKWNIVEKEAHAIITALKKNRHYLLGKKFIIRTDSRILSYLHSKRKPKNRKLLNWALELTEFDYEIVHIPSSFNEISDCLSRLYNQDVCAIIETPVIFNVAELKEMQYCDSDIKNAINYIKSDRKYFDVNSLGSLKRFRKKLKLDEHEILMWYNKFVIPSTLRRKVLELSHDHPLSGHFQLDRTWSRVSNNYFWPHAKNDVINWVRSCQKCNEFNTPARGYVKRPLMSIEITERFNLVCYDLAGPFIPKTDRGNAYAMVIIDHFSKWPELIALPDVKATTIARAIFDVWVCRYGVMSRLHSDGGSNVDGEVMHCFHRHYVNVD